jgi:hypothetical protein
VRSWELTASSSGVVAFGMISQTLKEQKAMAKTSRKEREYTSARQLAETHQSYERTCIKPPDGMSFFQPKKPGVYRIDIMPYVVGKGNPHAEEGNLHYERTYWTYAFIGPTNATYVAPGMTFKKKDPIAEYTAKLQQQPGYDKELVKKLRPKERQLFIIKDYDDAEKGYQLWDISYHLFGKHLNEKIKSCDKEDAERYDMFFHPLKGLLVRVAAKEETLPGRTYLEFSDIEFKKRPEQYSSDVVDEMPCLDDLLIEKSYKELKDIFFQTPADEDDEDEDEDETRSSDSRKSSKVAPRDEDEDADDEENPTSKHGGNRAPKSGKTTSRSDDEDGDDDEDEDSDEDGDDEPPTSKKTGKTSKPIKKGSSTKANSDEDDEDEEDEEDDESDDDAPVEEGQWIKFTYKGKKLTGKVVSINAGKKLFGVKCDDRPEPHNLGWADEFAIGKAPEKTSPAPKDEDDDDDDEDEDEPPKKASQKKLPSKKPTRDEDDEDEDDEDEDDDEDDEDEDDDDEPAPNKRASSRK